MSLTKLFLLFLYCAITQFILSFVFNSDDVSINIVIGTPIAIILANITNDLIKKEKK